MSSERNEPAAGQLLYPVPMAARVLGLSERTAWAFISRGEIKTRKCGARVLVHRTELEKFARADHGSPDKTP